MMTNPKNILRRKVGTCPICWNNRVPLKDDRLAYHAVTVDGYWLDCHPDDSPPECEGTGLKPFATGTYDEPAVLPDGINKVVLSQDYLDAAIQMIKNLKAFWRYVNG